MQAEVNPAIILQWAIILPVAIILFGGYWFFIWRPAKEAEKRIRSMHFITGEFIGDMQPQTFQYYDAKWTRLLFSAIGLSIAAVVLPVLLNLPERLVIMGFGLLISLVSVAFWNEKTADRERAVNQATTYGTMHCLFPDEGEVGLNVKRITVTKESSVTKDQATSLIGSLFEEIKKLPEYDSKKDTEAMLKKKWIERFAKMKAIVATATARDRVYHLLFIAEHSFALLKTPDPKDMIADTVHVSVPLAPMFSTFIGLSTKIFRAANDKTGKAEFTDRQMGVFVVLFDIPKRNELLLGGEYNIPSHTDVLFARYLELLEENRQTAISLGGTEQNLTKANQDIDEKKFEANTEAIVAATKKMAKLTEQSDKSTHEGISLGKWAKIALICVLIIVAAVVGFVVAQI